MIDETPSSPNEYEKPVRYTPEPETEQSFPLADEPRRPAKRRLHLRHAVAAVIMLSVYLTGILSGYGLWRLPTQEEKAAHEKDTRTAEIMRQVNPPEGYTVPASFGDLGPRMAAAGVFDPADFEQIYQQADQPLNQDHLAILNEGSDGLLIFNQRNAYFLLNFFWAVGLSSKNPILDEGPIQTRSQGQVENFASTGGWVLAKRPLSEIFSSLPLIILTTDQQNNLEEAALAVYRPCCDNPTHFPDCNHGMAMLGLLELLASQDATIDEMLEAARYANAYWYPSQTVEQALFFKNTSGQDYQDVDSRMLLGPQFSSGTGFQGLHAYLAQNNLLPQAPNSGNSCGV